MKTYKCLKAIKKNSEENDGHPDGTELLIFAEKQIEDSVKQQAKADGLPEVDKIYYTLIKNEDPSYPEFEYIPIGMVDFKAEIISDELFDFNTEDPQLIAYLSYIEDTLFEPVGFSLYS